ncbi:YcaO-like family protein [Streptomyces sp. 6N223]|uniref:YcaO-like family protein n=1 Tax=Streptomyces sp. 6N223 TaxID=3457412 RepID=UPI003FD0CE1F
MVTGPRVERVMSAEKAEQRALDAVRGLGLRAEVRELAALDGLGVWRCRLLDDVGAVVPQGEGSGKGRARDARVGALFEALEHYLTGPGRFDAGQVEFRSGAEVAAGALADEACATVLGAIPRVACRRYAPLVPGADEPIAVPVALSTSWYLDRPEVRAAVGDEADYTQLARYGSNSGSAIGVTRSEALVHALNESIERDALSLLLARAFLAAGPRVFRPQVVDPASLPAELAAAHRTAQRAAGGRVHLLDATTDIGVPTYIAYLRGHRPLGEMRMGAGSSLSPRYAAWRALTEVVQSQLGTAALSSLPSLPSLEAFEPYPALRACAEFELTEQLTRADTVAFPAAGEEAAAPGDVDAQLARLVELLTAAGHPPYYRVTAALPGGITAVHAIAPGLERFMTILSGMLLLPGPRARARLHVAAETAGRR